MDGPGAVQEGERERFLIIHLDGVSSQVFMDELEAGRLENLGEAFGEDGIIPYGVTFYPPFTSAVVSRRRHGIAADDGRVVDWEEYDPESREHLGPTGVFLSYAATVPRRARSTFLYGLPYMDPLAGLSLWNLPELVDTYGTLEFYWFGTDTAGHLWGEDALRRSLHRFDRHLPRALDRLENEVNLLIYADHGMVFAEAKAYDQQGDAVLDGRVEHYAYPNVYLRDGEDPEQVAQDLLEGSWLDLVFFRDGPDRTIGLHRGGRVDGPHLRSDLPVCPRARARAPGQQAPHREPHSVHGWRPLDSDRRGAVELSLSPRYRMRVGADLDGAHGDHAWAAFDVAGGILSRTWVGGGITDHPRTRPVVLLDHYVRVARLGLNARLAHGRPSRLDLVYRPLDSPVELRVRNVRKVGLGFRLRRIGHAWTCTLSIQTLYIPLRDLNKGVSYLYKTSTACRWRALRGSSRGPSLQRR